MARGPTWPQAAGGVRTIPVEPGDVGMMPCAGPQIQQNEFEKSLIVLLSFFVDHFLNFEAMFENDKPT
jgi:hypothetical protein